MKYATTDELAEKIIAEPHALIAGTTGSGKSTFLDTILFALSAYHPGDKSFCVIDLKRVSITKWKSFPHCQVYADDPETALELMENFAYTMEKRYEKMAEDNLTLFDGQEFYLIIDEAADLFDTVPEANNLLKHILRLGRAAKMHVILCTQSPDRKTISAQVQQNCTARLALRTMSAIESRQIIGFRGAENLPMYGKGILRVPSLMAPATVDVHMTDERYIDMLRDYWKEQPLKYKNK